jgi:hypothetical protein
VVALRQTIGNLAQGNRQSAIDSDLDKRRGEIMTEALLKELDTQRELLAERNRQLELAQDDLRRVSASRLYRAGQKVKALPILRRIYGRRRAEHEARLQATREQRQIVRRERSERFVNHHRGQ